MAKSLNKLMDDTEGRPEQKLIQRVALRAMMKAKYTVHNIGHFGLAFDYSYIIIGFFHLKSFLLLKYNFYCFIVY